MKRHLSKIREMRRDLVENEQRIVDAAKRAARLEVQVEIAERAEARRRRLANGGPNR